MPEPGTIIALALGLGFTAASAILAARKKQPSPIRDDAQAALSKRGSFAPYLIGRRRVPPIVAWVGNRDVNEHEGGGKFGGSGGSTTFTYAEDAIHVLAVGPCTKLYGIYSNGKLETSAAYDSISNASGASLSLTGGTFVPYWGESSQPINTVWGAEIGINSRWPYFCYGHWIRRRLRSSPVWPQLEYDLESRNDTWSPLASTPYWIEGSGSLGSGVNAGHALYQVLTGVYPHGLGIDPASLDLDGFEALGVLCEEENLAVNILADGGVEAATIITAILQEAGVLLPQSDGLLVPVPIREPDEVPDLSDDATLRPLPSISEVQDERPVDRLVFTYADAVHAFRTMDISTDDDSQARGSFHPKDRTIELVTVTSRAIAQVIANRREQEELSNVATFQFQATRGARVWRAGSVFNHADYGVMRVMAATLESDSTLIRLDCLKDYYGVAPIDYAPPDDPPPPPDPVEDEIAIDQMFRPFELPWGAATDPTDIEVTVFRAADSEVIEGATVHASLGGTTYNEMGNQNTEAMVGSLSEDLEATYTNYIIDSITVTGVLNAWILSQFADLSDNQSLWLGGALVVLIDDEILFAESITALGTDSFQFNNVIRARYDTEPVAHDAGAEVWIANAVDQIPLTGLPIAAFSTTEWKTRPFIGLAAVDLSLVTAESLRTIGRAQSPMPVGALRANVTTWSRNQYSTGEDIVIEWYYRVRGQGAGSFAWGAAQDAAPTFESQMNIDFLTDAGDLVVTHPGVGAPTRKIYTYTNADLQDDFGEEPSAFRVRVWNNIGSYYSYYRTIRIVKV